MCGSDKLLFQVGGLPLIRRLALEALHSRALEVIVAVGPDQTERKSALVGTAEFGMSESLKCGIASTQPDAEGAIILLPDMPGIQTRHINTLIDGFLPGSVVQACDNRAAPGNPVILPRNLFAAIMQLTGDIGARSLIGSGRNGSILVELPGNASQTDLDTRKEWAEWRAGRIQ
ncbi:MAG: nucleotidyltransferase family protein [Rhodobacteraceae bacterium]|nr:nucleotidyltransferase family protein [Paracoccaceae bacterium]